MRGFFRFRGLILFLYMYPLPAASMLPCIYAPGTIKALIDPKQQK
jgi:hypothetical protein